MQKEDSLIFFCDLSLPNTSQVDIYFPCKQANHNFFLNKTVLAMNLIIYNKNDSWIMMIYH